jgi:hypothetical protein
VRPPACAARIIFIATRLVPPSASMLVGTSSVCTLPTHLPADPVVDPEAMFAPVAGSLSSGLTTVGGELPVPVVADTGEHVGWPGLAGCPALPLSQLQAVAHLATTCQAGCCAGLRMFTSAAPCGAAPWSFSSF